MSFIARGFAGNIIEGKISFFIVCPSGRILRKRPGSAEELNCQLFNANGAILCAPPRHLSDIVLDGCEQIDSWGDEAYRLLTAVAITRPPQVESILYPRC